MSVGEVGFLREELLERVDGGGEVLAADSCSRFFEKIVQGVRELLRLRPDGLRRGRCLRPEAAGAGDHQESSKRRKGEAALHFPLVPGALLPPEFCAAAPAGLSAALL